VLLVPGRKTKTAGALGPVLYQSTNAMASTTEASIFTNMCTAIPVPNQTRVWHFNARKIHYKIGILESPSMLCIYVGLGN
jgi:hypothetical protein